VSFGFDLFLGAERAPKIEKHGAGNRPFHTCGDMGAACSVNGGPKKLVA
jgi:hypothetical protein